MNNKTIIDLTGPDGNAFVLLGYAQKFSKLLNLDFKAVRGEMTKGDYENLLDVFNKYFNTVAILRR